MLAAQVTEYGDPAETVKLIELPDPPAPQRNEVLVQMEYAPVNPADLLFALGYYFLRPPAPTLLGNEGVGTVLAVGADVAHLKVGDRIAAPLSSWTWRERMVVDADSLTSLPLDADIRQLAMVGVNPVTALLLLTHFRELKHGDWIVQTAANSGVGRSVIAFAKDRGIKTVNIVRRPELADELVASGADIVVVDGPDISEKVAQATAGAPIVLGFDCLSGRGAALIARLLSPGGTIVSYGAITGSDVALSPADMIYKGLELKTLFIGHEKFKRRFPDLINQAAHLIKRGLLNIPIDAVYRLDEVEGAIKHAQRGGKILLKLAVD